MIFASSDQLYAGNEEEGPYFENIIVKPNNVYGVTKLNAENEIKNIFDKYYNLRFYPIIQTYLLRAFNYIKILIKLTNNMKRISR